MDDDGKKVRRPGQGETKKRLLRAALDIFSKDGYDAATTRKIAKKAGVNESLIHRYFESKLGLFFSIMKDFNEHMVHFPAYEPGGTLEEELQNFFRFRLQFTRKRKKFFKLAFTRAILDSKVRDQIREFTRRGMPNLQSRLEDLHKQGKIKTDVNLAKVARLLGIMAFAMSVFGDLMETTDVELIDDLAELAAKLVAGGLSLPTTNLKK